MARTNLLKATIITTIILVTAVIVAAPLVVAKSNDNANKHAKQTAQSANDTSTNQVTDQTGTSANNTGTNQGTDQTGTSTTDTSNSGVHWASVAINNGNSPTVRKASNGSTSVTPNSGTTGAYTVTFPNTVHVLACTATKNNNGTQNVNQGPISCGVGDDVGLKSNQVQVLFGGKNNNGTSGSNFTVAVYDTSSP